MSRSQFSPVKSNNEEKLMSRDMKRWDSGSSTASAESASVEMTPEIGGDDNSGDDNGDVEALCRGGPRTRLSV